MVGRLALPAGHARGPAVLIAHDGSGLGEFYKDRAVRFAELGYVAFALDYHGGGQPISEEEAASRCDAFWFAPEQIRTLAGAALDVLAAEPRADPDRVAAVGYCFGGAFVLELARAGADLKAVVGFHPRLATMRPEDAAHIRGRVLVCVGSEDPFVSQQERIVFEDEMRAGGVDWQINIYGGAKHSFTRPGVEHLGRDPGNEYDEPSDRRSWQAMLRLFDETLT